MTNSPSFQQAASPDERLNHSGRYEQVGRAWKRLKKNKGAVFGLFVILLASGVAIFAYFIAPDPSPYANRIILEIGGKKPGTQQNFIKVKKDKEVSSAGFFSQLTSGKEDAYYFIPIVSHEQKNDSTIVQKYIDEGVTERRAYHKSVLPDKPVNQLTFLLGYR